MDDSTHLKQELHNRKGALIKMTAVSKKKLNKRTAHSVRRNNRSKIGKRIASLLLCLALLGTSIGGNVFEVYATENVPVEEINENQVTDGNAAEDAQRKRDDAETTSTEEEKPEEVVESGEPVDEAEAAYTLHITHYFRFTVNGEGRNVRSEETVTLTSADFEDGFCDVKRFAYNEPQFTVTEAKPLALASFDKDGVGGARIVYQLSDGWTMTSTHNNEGTKTVLRSAFDGQLSDYTFEAANVVRVNMNYTYSKTGGLSGMQAAAPQTLDALAEKVADDTYEFELSVPHPTGFRVVLNPEPLNQFMKVQLDGTETEEELKQIMEEGGFNADIQNNCLYYYQQLAGDNLATPDFSLINPTYQNRYSDTYNDAWNQARKFAVAGDEGYTIMAVCGRVHNMSEDDHGANALTDPKIRVTLTEQQLQNAQENGLDLSIAYRRNATWYMVNHWVPVDLSGMTDAEIAASGKPTKTGSDGIEYVCLDTDFRQGRAGSTTQAVRKTGSNYDLLVNKPFSQKLIESAATNAVAQTTVDIYYEAATSYRVIFDTDWSYIPRQQVSLNGWVTFNDAANHPTRKGYIFAGWQYLKKDATPDANNEYQPDDYIPVTKVGDSYELQITSRLITQDAKMKETSGVQSLHLYPIWVPDTTQITVVLWTEDLTGVDDVQAAVSGGNKEYYEQKYADYQDSPVTHKPVNADGTRNPNFSNVGDFTLQVTTDVSLVNDDDTLLQEIQDKVDEKFSSTSRDTERGDISKFFTQDSFEIMHEGTDGIDYTTTTANPDGKTIVYVYFTRKIYTLKFHYYGEVNGQTKISNGTNGYSHGGTEQILGADGELNFGYDGSFSDGQHTWVNTWAGVPDDKVDDMPVPQTITIRAKFDADLRNVWPVARPEEMVLTTDNNNAAMISWATTAGEYRDEAIDPASDHYYEATVMGLFASMNEDIIADPSKPETAHNLVAYWENKVPASHYRYTHCFEVPGLDITSDGVITISLHEGSTALKNTLYLVPRDNATFVKYGFTDLMPVSYQDGKVTYGDPMGEYYAVRGYQIDDTTIQYYGVGRRVDTVSTNAIEMQNPSARAHMSKANSIPDHTTKYNDSDGRTWGGSAVIVGADEPYDLYFYYDRDRYTIKYVVANTNPDNPDTTNELGHIELPYGTHITRQYAFELDYRDTNHAVNEDGMPKYLWSYPENQGAIPVCPDRNTNGLKEWKFKGWGLGPAGANMLWEFKEADPTEPQAQVEEDFYIASDLLIYAIWDIPDCTVTFHFNGGVMSSKEGSNLELTVPSNTKFTDSDARIPRPFKEGHTLVGWYLADESGAFLEPRTEFKFDDVVIQDVHVAAEWSAASTSLYSYNVYYVTKTLREEDKDKYRQTVKIKTIGDQSVIADDGEVYYVLKEEKNVDKVYADGMTINASTQAIQGYIPVNTNQTITLTTPDQVYNMIFFYESYTNGSHRVEFIEAGTESTAKPTIIAEMVVKTDRTIVTPDIKTVQKLIEDGYELVNKEADKTYTAVETYADLTWLDKAGKVQNMTVLHGDDIPDTIVFLVQPIEYTIQYENANGSPDSADDALRDISADENSSLDSALAQKKNPARYTVKDGFTLVNPASIYNADDGKWYQFAGWSLGDQTAERGNLTAGTNYLPLVVDAGTKGNLTFVANWTVSTDVGDLKVTNAVTGTPVDPDRSFTFTVTLNDRTVNGAFGGMTFVNGVATFELKDGETMTAEGLGAGIRYTVKESNHAGYTVTSTGAEGTITTGAEAVAAFSNNRKLPPAVDTGDSTNSNVWMLLLVLSGLGMLIAVRRSPRERNAK